MAVNNGVYTATSPTTLSYYVLLRKFYSIIAFAVLGYPAERARRASGWVAAPLLIGLWVAAYSGIIEVLQFYLDPPPEGLLSNAIDVACGFFGGYAGGLAAGAPTPSRTRKM